MTTIYTLKEITTISEAEEALVKELIGLMTTEVKKQYDASDAPGNIKAFEMDRKPMVLVASKKTGAKSSPAIRVALVSRAKGCGFDLQPLGGDNGDKFILTPRKGKGGGGRPKMTEDEKTKAKAKRDAKKAEKATAETTAK